MIGGLRVRKTTLTRIGAAVAISAILVGWASVPEASAAEFTVTRTDDPFPDSCEPDDCSLREAVEEANLRGGYDTIVLPGGTYTLSIPRPSFGDNDFVDVGDLDVSGNVSIVGEDGSVTIGGDGAKIHDRVFDIHGMNVSIERLSIKDGRAQKTVDENGDGSPDFAHGGGIRVQDDASLILGEVTLQNNTAESLGKGGAIYNAGVLGLVDVDVSLNDAVGGFGGGVYTNVGATTRLFDTTISANEAGFGGGLGAFGTTLVYRSTIDTNEAFSGGGIHAAGPNSLTSMTNSTMAHNRAAGSGSAIRGRVGAGITLDNVTIARNTSDIDLDGEGNAAVSLRNAGFPTSATLRNTIVAANEDRSPGQNDVPDCGTEGDAEVTLAGYDLLGNRNGCALKTPSGAEGNQIGDAADPTDPLLAGGLASNGGPTETLALLSGSPAINAGDPDRPGSLDGCAASDQRGAPRSNCDIGAYELVRIGGAVVNIVGTPGPDVLLGDSGDDAILGLGGADEISGGGGNDRVYGEDGNDRLFGGSGRDRLVGERGRDRLYGEGGRDSLNTRDGVRGNDRAHGGSDRDRCVSDRRDRTISCR